MVSWAAKMHSKIRCHRKLVRYQEDQTTLNKIDMGDVDRGISKITDIDWQSLSTMNPRNFGDNQGDGIKSITFATWMMSEDNRSSASYNNLLNDK